MFLFTSGRAGQQYIVRISVGNKQVRIGTSLKCTTVSVQCKYMYSLIKSVGSIKKQVYTPVAGDLQILNNKNYNYK